MNRRGFLALSASAAGAALAADARFREPQRLEVTHHLIGAPGPGRTRLRLAQISDLHLRGIHHVHQRLAQALAAARPDLMLFTGDAVDRHDTLPLLDRLLGMLDPRIPKYAILGNWEHWGRVDLAALHDLYARHGGRLLVNETALHHQGAARLAITGLDDLVGGRPDLAGATRGAEAASTRLLLAHCPEHRDLLAHDSELRLGGTLIHAGVDLSALGFTAMLSGHTHGGQVAFGGVALVVPRGSGRYLRGWYRDPGVPPLYVSRGIGTSVLPVRFGSEPELALFELWV